LGAGYDTRAYRIEGLKNIKVFEIDHPATQTVKIEVIKKIFGCLPDHVIYIPADLENEDFGQRLQGMGYNQSKKTLLIMEGLSYYLPPEVVDAIMCFITKNSGKGSAIIFDYFPRSVADGSTRLEVGRNFYSFAAQIGEPLQFGIEESMIKTFLVERGFSKIHNVTSEDYKRAYFHGVNKDRTICSIMSIAHAVIE
jgi:methyltransferase (TIGR00027 family)